MSKINSIEMNNNEDIFENFLKYDFVDEDDEEDDDEDDDADEFHDALSESNNNCDRLKRKNERLKSVSSENLSITSFDEISQMRNEQFEKFKKRENEFLHCKNSTETTDLSQLDDLAEIKDDRLIKSLQNKKLRDELIEIKNLNLNLNSANDISDDYDLNSKMSNVPSSSTEFKSINETDNTRQDYDSEDSFINTNKNIDKYKTWPSNSTTSGSNSCITSNANTNNVQNLLNSINETQDTATHLKQTNNSNEKLKSTGGIETMKLASGLIGNSQDTDNKHVAYSIQSTDEFISPVDRQIAAIFRMTNPTNETINISNTDTLTKKNLRRNVVKNNDMFNDNCEFEDYDEEEEEEEEEEEDDDDDDDDEDEDIINEKSEIKSLDHNTFRRIYKTSNLDNMSVDGDNMPSSVKSKTRESIRKVIRRFGRAVKHVQNKAEEVLNSDQLSESDSDDINLNNETNKTIKFKAARNNKSSHEFANAQIIQTLNSNNSTNVNQVNTQTNLNNSLLPVTTNSNCIIWVMKFSSCGKLLATAGKDQLIRIWVLKSFYEYFKEMIKRHNNDPDCIKENDNNFFLKKNISVNTAIGLNEDQAPFYSRPFLVYSGHQSDILDVSWSKNLFLLSSSADKTCRLWHIYKKECLCTFYHSSIVSAISFHPIDDRYFVSACLDGKLRLWNISDKRIISWNDLKNQNKQKYNFITAICFCQSGKTVAVGTFDGKCYLYHTEQLKYLTLINVRSTRGKNKRGSKITGIEVLNNDENKLLITSNDSRIRLYDLRDASLICKYKGFSNSTVHIKAFLSHDDSFIISGSKNKCTYIWRTNYNSISNSGRRDRNMYWERIQAHNAVVTCALFHPKPQLILDQIYAMSSNINTKRDNEKIRNLNGFYVFASVAGCDGIIKILTNKLACS